MARTRSLHTQVFDTQRWDAVVAEAARRHQVPGIVAGVLHIDPDTGMERRLTASTGITHRRTGIEADKNTVGQIGSITKIVTATMIMQLREEGKLELTTPVVDLLPEFALASPHARQITVEQLLTHTSGIDGDLFTDTGRGDDAVAAYIQTLSEARLLFTPGRGWSYCNSGFVIAGCIIEVLDGCSWDESVIARINRRLDIDGFLTLPEQVLGHRHLYGHIRHPGQRDWNPAPASGLPRSIGPAGGITSSVDDLLDFGAVFLRQGQTPTGQPLLSPESVELMASPQWTLDAPVGSQTYARGLGWILEDWNGHPVHWHGGATIGNRAWFYVLPEDDLVFVVFCNGGVASCAAHEVAAQFGQVFAGARPAPALQPSADRKSVV